MLLATPDKLVLIRKAPAVVDDERSSERRMPVPREALSLVTVHSLGNLKTRRF